MQRTTLAAFACFLGTTAAASAQVLHVPTQHATIAAALAAATSGATILVAPGTYLENLTWPSTDGIRLVAAEGPAVTTIDAGQSGRAIDLDATALTRATLIDGFTITGGLLNGGNNYGAGIRIGNGSPTIRGNRITGNISEGTRNYGGAIFVDGSSGTPLIAHNEIDANELHNGSWNYGAGIYADSPAVIVGNHIHDNACLTTNGGTGHRGHGAGVYVDAAVVVASNVIVGNTNNTGSWNYGAGIKVATSGDATIVGNTIVGNTVVGGNWNYGAGIHLEGSCDATLRGNIIASNSGHGIYLSFGSGQQSSDYDNLWNNSGTNYVGILPGANNTTLDPLFVGPSDLHLQPGSPLIDAMPASALASVTHPDLGIDFDADPRWVATGTSATPIDVGADEFTDARLTGIGPAQIGNTWLWTVESTQPALAAFATAWSTANAVTVDGNLLLGNYLVIGGNATPASFPLPLGNPALQGLTLHGQGYVLPLTSLRGHFTNRLTITTY